VIDLHLHTTASDGRCTPRDLVTRAWTAGLRVIAVTDHDTMAAIPEVVALGRHTGLEVIPGLEITAVLDGRDIHVLGYFPHPGDPGRVERAFVIPEPLDTFLVEQRQFRIARVQAVGRRLAELGRPIDVDALLAPALAHPGYAIGRPQIAAALVAAGHVADTRAAFDSLLGDGRPACVPREGVSPVEVVRLLADVGAIAALAHPALYDRDDLVPALAEAGMPALEVYHSDHSPQDVERYRGMAASLGLLATGGSDFHGSSEHGKPTLGSVTLPEADLVRLKTFAARQVAARS
jgi:3',5'-nucleoside bisphosphate phosphatase